MRLVQVLSFMCLGCVAMACHADLTAPAINGDWQQGAVLRGFVKPGQSLRFLKRQVPIATDGSFVIGLGRDFPAQTVITVSSGAESQLFTYGVAQREYAVSRVDGVPARTVNPDPKHLTRIRGEAAQARAARKRVSDRQDYRKDFQWPLLGRISGVYGSQRYYNGEARRPHYGVDVAAPTGTQVRAPISGRVTLTHNNMFFSGGTLIVDHGQGLSSTFMHLSKILVKEGDVLQPGQVIAEVGATGRVTGPHLDWRMNWFNQRVDPALLVPPMEQTLAAADKSAEDKSTDKSTAVE